MAIKSFYEYNQKVAKAGQSSTVYYRKLANTVSSVPAGNWVDASMFLGHPASNYYASTPLAASLLDPVKGMYLGPVPSGTDVKTISYWSFCTNLTGTASSMLLDYMLYYPFIEGDEPSVQVFDNTVQLPSRGSNGDGVQMFLVAQGSYLGGGNCTISYTNSVGQSKTTVTSINTAGSVSVLANSSLAGLTNTFIPLTMGDRGVRSVQSVQFSTAVGGVFALVLVKPLMSIVTFDNTSAVEKPLLTSSFSMPVVYSDSFIGFISNSSGAIVSTVSYFGSLQTIWG